MNIKADFLNSLISSPQPSSGFQAEDFLGHIYTEESDTDSPLFQLFSCGTFKVSFPFSFDIRSLDCSMLLYTIAGCGKLLLNNQVYSLLPSSLLLLDCHERFRLDIATEPFEYHIFFITGNSLSYYYDLLPEKKPILTSLTGYCETALCLKRLLSFSSIANTTAKLSVSYLINTIITNCIISQINEFLPHTPVLPAYLTEMKELFDNSFQEYFTLDELAKRFHVSKYRLCREFSNAFGMSPLQYLNHRRIYVAGHLLLTTSLKIHEVGSTVGIENTNHFISLFRKINGTTPLEYKQRMTT